MTVPNKYRQLNVTENKSARIRNKDAFEKAKTQIKANSNKRKHQAAPTKKTKKTKTNQTARKEATNQIANPKPEAKKTVQTLCFYRGF